MIIGFLRSFCNKSMRKNKPLTACTYNLGQDAWRHREINIDLHFKFDILQVRNRLLTTLLLIRCDYTVLLTFLHDRKDEAGASSPSAQVDLSIIRTKCEEEYEENAARFVIL